MKKPRNSGVLCVFHALPHLANRFANRLSTICPHLRRCLKKGVNYQYLIEINTLDNAYIHVDISFEYTYPY
jgi:hypothetical protein